MLALLSDELRCLGGGEGALRLNARIIDLLEDPIRAVEGSWATLFDADVVEPHLFEDVRQTLLRNGMLASGVNPDEPRTERRRFVRPTEQKRRPPAELADLYLRNSPFHDFLTASLPLPIPQSARFEHTHVLGGTGHGKSQLLLNLIQHDLDDPSAPGVVVIDSQGDLIRTLSRLARFDPDVRESLAERLILIDPNDVEFPVSLNLFGIDHDRLDRYSRADRERLVYGAVELYEYAFSALLGAELTQRQGVIFRFLARLMVAIPGATIHTLRELMEDGRPYREHMAGLDGAARRFFETEFFDRSFAPTKKQILKRLWGVLANPVFERLFSQAKSTIDFFEAMNDGKIVLVSTAKDLLKEEGCAIFGRFLIAKVAQAVVERAVLPEADRRPAFLYLDEAHDYADRTFAHLLNQARKYRVGLTLAHQNLDQLSAGLRADVMASTSIKLAGGVSAKDARAIAEEMRVAPEFVQSMRKRRGATSFAGFVKSRTPRGIEVSVPLGVLDAEPTLSDLAYTRLINHNRARYCIPLEELAAPAPPRTTVAPAASPTERAPTRFAELEADGPAADTAPALPPVATTDPYVAEQRSREHRYLQELIRQAAQERGFRADIEWRLEEPAGRVDVSVEGFGARIACEVSVTTSAEHEIGNARKCLAAGYHLVWIIVTAPRRATALAALLDAQLAEEQRARVQVLSSAEAIERLDQVAAGAEPEERLVRGYRVKVRTVGAGTAEATARRAAIARVLAGSLAKAKKEEG
jgi:hypothetical protein